MGGGEIAKDAIRIVTTAGLSKDVIDLLKEKIALLTKQITALETENSNLKKRVADLEQELTGVRPKGDLHPDAVRFLKVLFEQGAQPVSQIAALLGIQKGFGEYHRDELLKREMIGYPMVRTLGRESSLLLKPKGRAYLVVHEQV